MFLLLIIILIKVYVFIKKKLVLPGMFYNIVKLWCCKLIREEKNNSNFKLKF